MSDCHSQRSFRFHNPEFDSDSLWKSQFWKQTQNEDNKTCGACRWKNERGTWAAARTFATTSMNNNLWFLWYQSSYHRNLKFPLKMNFYGTKRRHITCLYFSLRKIISQVRRIYAHHLLLQFVTLFGISFLESSRKGVKPNRNYNSVDFERISINQHHHSLWIVFQTD